MIAASRPEASAEAYRAIVDDWLEMPMNREIFENSNGKFCPERIRLATDQHLARSMALSDETFHRFLGIAGSKDRPIRLGSGHER